METNLDTNNNNDNSKAKVRYILTKIIVYLFLIFLSFLCIFFFYLLLINITRSNNELQSGDLSLVPSEYFSQNFSNLFGSTGSKLGFNAITGFSNSLIVALGSSLLTCYFSALTAYGIYAYDFKFKKVAEVFILAIMMIPTQLSSVGFFELAVKYNMKNQLWLLIIPSIAAPSVFFYMIQYLRSSLPKDLIEASRMDGSSEFGTFNRIVLPIMKPALAVQFIFSFVASWNNLYMPSLLLSDDKKKTLPIMINSLQHTSWGSLDLGCVYMAIFLSILPVVIVYLILSKSIIKGVPAGSVKG